MVLYRKSLLFACLGLLQFASAYQKYEQCVKPGVVALTFDDGPNVTTEKVLDLLKKENIKATFFVNGKNYMGDVRENPTAQELIKREYNEGHIVGSHTFSHPADGITKLTDEQLTSELKDLNDLLYDLIQVKPAFFRPPLGEYNERNEKVIESQGFTANINWNIDPLDWDNKGKNPLEAYVKPYKKILSNADPSKDSFIALNHDVYENTVTNLIPEVIKMVREHGFKFVTMDECLGLSPYQNAGPAPTTYSSNSTLVETTTTQAPMKPTQTIVQNEVKQNLEKSGSVSTMTLFSLSTVFLIALNIVNLL